MRYIKHFTPLLLGVVAAQANAAAVVTLNNPAPKAGMTLWDFIYLLIDIMQLIGVPMLAMAIIYAGYLMVTAGGNEEQISKAKMWFMWTAVGAAIVLGATVIAKIVKNTAAAF